MCEYCGNERKPIHSQNIQKENALINTVVGFDKEGYLVTSTILQTVYTLRPYHLKAKTIVDFCPMCGEETELYKKNSKNQF